MSAITVEGDLIHYEKLGRGRPVILLHGWVGSWRYWVPTMQVLQAKFSVYALDLYGFGDTAKNVSKYALERQAELVAAFVREMGIPKAAFVAHGWGAVVAAEFARRNPDKAARLLLVSAPLFEPKGGLADRTPPGMMRALTPPPLVIPPTPPAPAVAAADPTIPSSNTVDRATLARAYAALARSTGAEGKPAVAPTATPTVTPANAPATTAAAKPVVAPPAPAVSAATPSNTPARPLTDIALGKSGDNPLVEILAGDLEGLLSKCFKRSAPEFDKLKPDLAKTDIAAIKTSTVSFDALEMLDRLHVLDLPMVFVHGADDPIIANPSDEVWSYLGKTKTDEKLLAIPLGSVRHFPMLENDRFSRLVTDFLEKADISTIEVQERWKRRSR